MVELAETTGNSTRSKTLAVPQVSTDIYRAIFERSLDAILVADDEARLIDANPAAEQLTGYTRDELLRMRIFDLTLSELRHDTDAMWQAFLAEGSQFGPFDLQRKDGTRRRVHYRAAANVTPGAHVSMLRDLTREEATFGDLQLSEQLLDAVFEHSPIGLQVFAADGRILRANRAWERLWGVSRSALAGYNLLDDPQLREQGFAEHLRAAVAGQTVVVPAFRYDPAESEHPGRVRWLTATMAPVASGKGQIAEVVLALEDLTERRESDRRASIQYAVSRILAESAGIDEAAPLLIRAIGEALDWAYGGLWLLDSSDGLLHCVNAWARGGAGADHFLGEMCRRFPPGEGLPGFVFQSREPYWVVDLDADITFPRLRPACEAGFCSGVGIPVMVGGRALGALEFFTRRRSLPDERLVNTLSGIGNQIGQYIERRAAERSEAAAALAANNLKDEFLAVLSHELRTPLNAILGWTRLLRGQDIDPATRGRALEIIERNVHAQTRIVDDLLDVSRIITGKLRLDVQPVDLVRIVRDVMESMRPAAEAKAIQMSLECDAGDAGGDQGTGAAITGDPHRLQQIVWNLLSNAIKFTLRGGRVDVAVRRHDDALLLSVADTGSGIAPELLPRVFDRFLQADSSSARQHGGLGLGLAIVRHLTELHGGSVSAESPGVGKGATFRLWLPLSADASDGARGY